MKVTVKSNLKHDGHRYAAGQALELSDDQAKSLIEAGVVEEVAEATEAEVDHPAIVTDEEGNQGIDVSKLNRKELESFAVENELMTQEEAASYAKKPELLEAVEAALDKEGA